MNTEPPFVDDFSDTDSTFDAETAEHFRRQAGAALLITLGVGLAAAALVHFSARKNLKSVWPA